MNEMLNYFKDEKAMYEFTLINLEGQLRKNLLKISYDCYTTGSTATAWYSNILSKIEDKRAVAKLERLYNEMVG